MVRLQAEPLDTAEVIRAVGAPGHGGLALFVGTTRAEDGVVALHYEAHREMAETELAAIVEEATRRFGARCAIAHRLGRVAVGEPSVAVEASAPHRPEAFAACRHLIDEAKGRAPIWKRDETGTGPSAWHDGIGRPAR